MVFSLFCPIYIWYYIYEDLNFRVDSLIAEICAVLTHSAPEKNAPRVLKGIDRSFELRCEIRLNRFVMTNWRLGNFFYFILKGQHHKISKKPIDAA